MSRARCRPRRPRRLDASRFVGGDAALVAPTAAVTRAPPPWAERRTSRMRLVGACAARINAEGSAAVRTNAVAERLSMSASMRAETLCAIRAVRGFRDGFLVARTPGGRDTTAGLRLRADLAPRRCTRPPHTCEKPSGSCASVTDGTRHAAIEATPPRWLRIAGGFRASVSASNTKTWPEPPRPRRAAAAPRDPAARRARARTAPHGDVVAAARAPKAATRTRRVATKVSRAFRCVSFPGERSSRRSRWTRSRTASRPRAAEKSGVRFSARPGLVIRARLAPRTPRRPPPCPARARPGSRPRARRSAGKKRATRAPCPRGDENLFGREPTKRRALRDRVRTRRRAPFQAYRRPRPRRSTSLSAAFFTGRKRRSSRRRPSPTPSPGTREEPRGARTRNLLAGLRVPPAAPSSVARLRRRLPSVSPSAVAEPFGRRRQGRHRARAGGARRTHGDVVETRRVFFERERPDRALRWRSRPSGCSRGAADPPSLALPGERRADDARVFVRRLQHVRGGEVRGPHANRPVRRGCHGERFCDRYGYAGLRRYVALSTTTPAD